MNDDTTAGKFDQLKGKVKESVGEAVGNERLANSGAADQVKGAVKESWGNTKDAVHDAANSGTVGSRTGTDSYARDTTTGQDVRDKVVSTAENAKETIKEKTDNIRRGA